MSPTRQASPERLFMRSSRCSLNIESVRLFRRLGGGQYKKKQMEGVVL